MDWEKVTLTGNIASLKNDLGCYLFQGHNQLQKKSWTYDFMCFICDSSQSCRILIVFFNSLKSSCQIIRLEIRIIDN